LLRPRELVGDVLQIGQDHGRGHRLRNAVAHRPTLPVRVRRSSIMSSIAESAREDAWKPRWNLRRFDISSSSETPETDWRRFSSESLKSFALSRLRFESCESEPILVMSCW